jgi:pyrimidine operon attenuation protein/uracil phosphoribosyltransferase
MAQTIMDTELVGRRRTAVGHAAAERNDARQDCILPGIQKSIVNAGATDGNR